MTTPLCPKCHSPLGERTLCPVCLQARPPLRSGARASERSEQRKAPPGFRLDPEIYERLAHKVIAWLDLNEPARARLAASSTEAPSKRASSRQSKDHASTPASAGVAASVSRCWSFMSALATSDAERHARKRTLLQSMTATAILYLFFFTAAGFYIFHSLIPQEPEVLSVAHAELTGIPEASLDSIERDDEREELQEDTPTEEFQESAKPVEERVETDDEPKTKPVDSIEKGLLSEYFAKRDYNPLDARRAVRNTQRAREDTPAEELVEAEENAEENAEKSAHAEVFSNRKGDARKRALERFGGNEQTMQALEKGLRFLAGAQLDDGSWSNELVLYHDEDKDPYYGMGVETGADNGITALALLAFLGAGHTASEGTHKECVRKGLLYLLKIQRGNGTLRNRRGQHTPGNNHNEIYNTALVTLCFCEASGLHEGEDQESYSRAARNGIRFFERAQNKDGGWTYESGPGTDTLRNPRSDASINGWVALIMMTADEVGLDVRASTRRKLASCIDDLTLEDSGETYYAMDGWGSTRKGFGMTAVGMTTRRVLRPEKYREVDLLAGEKLLDDLPSWNKLRGINPGKDSQFHTMYAYYYGCLAMFQATGGMGEHWASWNSAIQSMLLSNQNQKGDGAGSWDAVGHWFGSRYGTIYSTAFACLMLEVYFRHEPDPERIVPALAKEDAPTTPHDDEAEAQSNDEGLVE